MANLTDADKVIRNDVGKTIASKLDDIADAIVQQGGGAHTLDQLSDVDIDNQTLAGGQSIVYNSTTQKFENNTDPSIGDLSTLTTTDKSSLVGAVNEVNGAVGAKADKTQTATFTPESGVTVMHISSGYTDKQGCISAEIRFTGSANTWKTLGTLSIKPNDSCQVIGINTGTGAPVGIVRLRNDTGAVEVYPTSSISNAAVGFSIAFVIA